MYASELLRDLTLKEAFDVACGGHPYRHQEEAAERILEGRSVIIRAPCGSGKTEACFIPFLLAAGGSLPGRLIYSLPTQALVEDVAERLKKKVRKLGVPLSVSCQHGANPEDPFFKGDIIVATIDQTIGAYCCTPLSLPAFLGNIPAGAVTTAFLCFDEAHTYDHLLGLQSMLNLIDGHKRLELPFVVMSATLPDSFIKWFENRGIEIVEGRDEYVPYRENRRVHINWLPKMLNQEEVLKAIPSNGKVMVVCNTVFRAQEIYRRISEKLSEERIPVFILHSRFLPRDRRRIEEDMKAIFKNEENGCLVTTQVCEVGLDVSCDVMLTEVAPPDSLVQRIGRCARGGGTGQVFVYDTESSAPYHGGLLERTKGYIMEHLDGKILGWEEELAFVNVLLNDEFRRIMEDERHRMEILKNLGDAAFKGDKQQIEENIRRVLNANLTIHGDPESLKTNEILRMPWISLDVAVLRSQLSRLNAKYWRIRFSDDEKGRPAFEAEPNGAVWPHEYYVISPEFAGYSPDIGLVFGEGGASFEPCPRNNEPVVEKEYPKEPWITHAENCLIKFEELVDQDRNALNLFARILRSYLREARFSTDSLEVARGLIALCVALHDLGKLNEEWQRAAGAADVPLAHVPISQRRSLLPPHATISGYALLDVLSELTRRRLGCIMALAIAHHHHTRAIDVIEYRLRHMETVRTVLKCLEEKYGLSVELNEIKESNEDKTQLPAKMIGIEKIKSYTAYTIVSRFIRLSDRASLEE